MKPANLRKLAEGAPCQVRIPGVCNGISETTVLAHLPMVGISGMGMKCPDTIGTWACSACHDEIDARTSLYNSEQYGDYVQRSAYEGMCRTLNELHRRGYRMVKVEDEKI